jgi:hypothetical protein
MGVAEGTDFFWWFVKYIHSIGETGAKLALEDMRAHGKEPTSGLEMALYFTPPHGENDSRVAQAIKAATGKVHYPSKWVPFTGEVEAEGKAIAAELGVIGRLKEQLQAHPRIALSAGLLLLGGLVLLVFLTSGKKGAP